MLIFDIPINFGILKKTKEDLNHQHALGAYDMNTICKHPKMMTDSQKFLGDLQVPDHVILWESPLWWYAVAVSWRIPGK